MGCFRTRGKLNCSFFILSTTYQPVGFEVFVRKKAQPVLSLRIAGQPQCSCFCYARPKNKTAEQIEKENIKTSVEAISFILRASVIVEGPVGCGGVLVTPRTVQTCSRQISHYPLYALSTAVHCMPGMCSSLTLIPSKSSLQRECRP